MARADLHHAFAVDRDIFEASQVDPTLLDPVVRVDSLPGQAKPFVVTRVYQGPQGLYSEHFVLRDRHGNEVTRSEPRRIHLSGEMFENRFDSAVTDVTLSEGSEHQLTFYVDDADVATIPVFVEAGLGGDATVAAEETFKKALQKGSIIWLTLPPAADRGRRGKRRPEVRNQPVWFVFDAGKVYVFTGPTEQQVEGLPEADRVLITARSKDHRSEVSRVPATVRVVPADDDQWTRIARAGLGRRLNLPDGDRALDRWRSRCTLVELTPVFREAETAA